MEAVKKHRLARKMKKVFKKHLGHVSAHYMESLAWVFYKPLVIARNYTKAGIPYTDPQWQQWIKNGLLADNYWYKKLNIQLK